MTDRTRQLIADEEWGFLPCSLVGAETPSVQRLLEATEQTVPAENFMATIAANVDNDELSDGDFRDFIRRTLPIVQYPRRKNDERSNPGK